MAKQEQEQQKKEWQERMYQHKLGTLLALIEKNGDMRLRQKAQAIVNTNWYTNAPDGFDWAAKAREEVYRILQDAVEAGLVRWRWVNGSAD